MIPLKEYDPQETVWNVEDMVKYFVNKRDARVYAKYEAPEMKEKMVKVKLEEGAGLWSFITGCLP